MNKELLELIGNTPLVEIRNLNPNPDVKILAKIEAQNRSEERRVGKEC